MTGAVNMLAAYETASAAVHAKVAYGWLSATTETK